MSFNGPILPFFSSYSQGRFGRVIPGTMEGHGNLARLLVALFGLLLAFSACGNKHLAQEDASASKNLPPVRVSASVDKAVATTGDIITYTLKVERDPAYQVKVPEMGAEIAGFRIVDLGSESSEASDGRVYDTYWYKLRADLVGSYVLPAAWVEFASVAEAEEVAEEQEARTSKTAGSEAEKGGSGARWEQVGTSEIFVEVESVLPANEEATDIKDIKPLPPRRLHLDWMWIGIALALLVLAFAVALYFWRRSRRPRVEPQTPPHELAFRALDSLRSTDFEDLEALRKYYFAISEVLREYVEARFGLNATDLTTEEILGHLVELAELSAENRKLLRRFLLDTDMVKFAAHRPGSQEIEACFEAALGFVESTVPEPLSKEPSQPEPMQ